MHADMGADIDDDVAGADQLTQQIELDLAGLAIGLQRPADIDVIAIVERDSSSAQPQAVESRTNLHVPAQNLVLVA